MVIHAKTFSRKSLENQLSGGYFLGPESAAITSLSKLSNVGINITLTP